jgi:hypothetical protein
MFATHLVGHEQAMLSNTHLRKSSFQSFCNQVLPLVTIQKMLGRSSFTNAADRFKSGFPAAIALKS